MKNKNNKNLPKWLKKKLPEKSFYKTKKILEKNQINTVCEEAKCPNIFDCLSKKCATFLALGKYCTRKCSFCNIKYLKNPPPPDEKEIEKIALSAKLLKLKHITITMVTRDDLIDGGALHLSKIIEKLKIYNPKSSIEILTSDFSGKKDLLDIVLQKTPKIFAHNLETTKFLTPKIRYNASYIRCLNILQYVKEKYPKISIKSGIMVGLGETIKEIKEVIKDLKDLNCDIITIGQYLQPTKKNIPVKSYLHPSLFKQFKEYGYSLGVKKMISNPFVRSSLNFNIKNPN
jgi:lipoic acid synthetase